jgi:hypothetical protein
MDADTPYYDALGRFLAAYARAEATAQILLWHVSGIDLETARIIWPSMRVKSIAEMVRKLYRERKQKMPPLVDEALSHLVAITGIRDNAVHYATETDERGNRYVANMHQQFHLDDPAMGIVSVQLLHTLTADLAIIVIRFMTEMPPGVPEVEGVWRQAIARAPTPFLYISPQQGKKNRGSN